MQSIGRWLADARDAAGGAAAHAVRLYPPRARAPAVVLINGGKLLLSTFGAENQTYVKNGQRFDWAAVEQRLRGLNKLGVTMPAIAAERSATARDLFGLLDTMATAGFELVGVLSAADASAALAR